ncbi:hypothetical protein DPMN_104007 [Dreissena polymorpha]|uniref:Uncharacterized protein n=1 Tax=Dreissena polymorpha TaxID=45954 RepID=A0A9D4H939_DREPO|nr:hypothetical protein DPMN_104007 [Dreissena polymorpha]
MMAKSRAEIMRDYRKRMKEDPERYREYLAQARNRKRKNYVAAEKLTKKEKEKRSEKNKEYLSRHRQKKKLERELETARRDLDQPTPESSGYDTGRSESTSLVVDFQFPNRRNGPRRRVSNALAKKQRELRRLKAENEEMRLKYQRTLRRLQRYKKAEKKTDESECSTQQEYEESLK